MTNTPQISLPQHRYHPRQYRENKFVYPVLSRRSKGISIGVNLNPDKVCNFDCIYCQVNRQTQSETRFVEMDRLLGELDAMLPFVASGELFEVDTFQDIPAPLRRLNDIAFSGDGEPTTYRNFDAIMASVAAMKRHLQLDDVKMVLITNASMFHRETVRRGLEILDANNGEIWAKLEAGSEAYFKLIDRTPIRFQQILDNITAASIIRPIVIQSLFMNVNGTPPPPSEVAGFCLRLKEIIDAGGQLKLVQIYTVARPPALNTVTALRNDQVDAIANQVTETTGLPTEVYSGAST
ncbi:MAG: radical SAM protein [Planctomycetaceae bacterium]|nr:radical SAM protein [Planctomycetaceae bacterium]